MTTVVCLVVPAVLYFSVATSLAKPAPQGWYHAVDFHAPWQASRAFTGHHDPYVKPSAFVSSGPHQSFGYPAPTAALLVPFGLLSYRPASLLFVSLLTIAVVAALWLFGVRDWRCYGAAFASPAVMTAISVGTLTPLLLLGVAATWRWRDRALIAACAAGLTALLKIFLWPVIVWLWFTGRRRAALAAVAIDATLSILAWAWISFAGFTGFPRLMQQLASLQGRLSYAPLWAGGASSSSYIAIAVLVAAIVAYTAHRNSSDARSLAVAVLCALLATPVLWLHYFALLVAVAALARPRLSLLWLLPLAFWVTPQQASNGSLWRIGIALAVVTVAAAATIERAGSAYHRFRVALLPARAP